MSATEPQILEPIVYNFTRTNYEQKFESKWVPIALKQMIIRYCTRIFPSKILSIKQDADFFKLLKCKLGKTSASFASELLYRASEHGFDSKIFHDKCDGHASTITIIKSDIGNIFGGYADIKWPHASKSEFKPNRGYSKGIFMFSIRRNGDTSDDRPIIFASKSDKSCLVSCRNKGPIFDSDDGGSNEIFIDGDNSFTSRNDDAFDYKTFSFKTGVSGTKDPGGYFKVTEYEVFKVQ